MPWKALALALLVLPAAGLAGCVHHDNAWALRATGLDDLLARGLTGSSVRVALLDTGIDLGAPGLRHLDDGDPSNGELVGYADFVGEEGRPRDRNGHGTFVAGVLAGGAASGPARLWQGPAIAGAAPQVQLLVGRVIADDQGSMRALAHALAWALDQQADVVSLSLGISSQALQGQPETARALHGLLARAEREGVLVVAAAGNAGLLFPADQPTVLAVGAVDRQLRPLQAPASGKPDLYAPGRDITGPGAGGGLVGINGTSAAVPFVVAAAALLISAGTDPHDAAGVDRLRAALATGATGLGPGAYFLRADRSLTAYVRIDPKS